MQDKSNNKCDNNNKQQAKKKGEDEEEAEKNTINSLEKSCLISQLNSSIKYMLKKL